MGRIRVLGAALCAAGVTITAGGVVAAAAASPPAAAAAAISQQAPAVVPGSYVVQVHWDGGGWNIFGMTLYGNHNATDSYGDPGTWTKVGKTVTIAWNSGISVYIGTKNKKGFDNPKKPGTVSNDVGDTGIWYATVAPPG